MNRQTQQDEMQRELHATLSAMREVGPAYEDHLVESFVQKFTQQAIAQLREQVRPAEGPTSGQRLGLAVVSITLLLTLSIPIIALLNGEGAALLALTLLCLTVLGVNYLFNRRQ